MRCRFPAIPRLWRTSWELFTPFLDYEIRKVLCSTNAIQSLNARYRRAVTAKGHFPTEQAALKTLYLVTRSLDPKGTGQARRVPAGSRLSTPSLSPSPTGCQRQRTSDENAAYTVHRTDPSATAPAPHRSGGPAVARLCRTPPSGGPWCQEPTEKPTTAKGLLV